jgi:hypothetical protein
VCVMYCTEYGGPLCIWKCRVTSHVVPAISKIQGLAMCGSGLVTRVWRVISSKTVGSSRGLVAARRHSTSPVPSCGICLPGRISQAASSGTRRAKGEQGSRAPGLQGSEATGGGEERALDQWQDMCDRSKHRLETKRRGAGTGVPDGRRLCTGGGRPYGDDDMLAACEMAHLYCWSAISAGGARLPGQLTARLNR